MNINLKIMLLILIIPLSISGCKSEKKENSYHLDNLNKKVHIYKSNLQLSNKTKTSCNLSNDVIFDRNTFKTTKEIQKIIRIQAIDKTQCANDLAQEFHENLYKQKNNISLLDENENDVDTNYDVLVVGGGIHSSIFNMNYSIKNPTAKILTIDSSDVLAEQFFTSDFLINSPEINALNTKPAPVQPLSTNTLPKAPIQLADLSADKFHISQNLWNIFVFNQFASKSDFLLKTKISKIEYQQLTKRFKVSLENLGNVYAKKVVISTGLGDPIYPKFEDENFLNEQKKLALECTNSNCLPKVMTFDDALRINRIWKNNGKNILNKLSFPPSNNIAVVGSGDASYVFMEFLYEEAPATSAYINLDKAYNPNRNIVHWFAQKNRNAAEFMNDTNVKPRYKTFKKAFYQKLFDRANQPTDMSQINLSTYNEHITSIGFNSHLNELIVKTDTAQQAVDYIILSTGYKNLVPELIEPILGKSVSTQELKDHFSNINNNKNSAIARQLKINSLGNINLYLIGPAAGTTPDWQLASQTDLDNSFTKNAVSINVLGSKTAEFAEKL